ncbi:MAG: cardiolipin synthase [Ruminococcus sp.]|nr:cardiolipin synthase [Ruminococcus sp.]
MRILKKIANILTSRLIIIGLLILMQLAWFVILMSRLSLYAHWVDVVLTVCSVLIELYIIRHDGNPSYKILWLLFIGLLPVLGSLMYLFFGNKRPSYRMWRCLHHGCHVIGSRVPRDSVVGQISSRAGGLVDMLESSGFPMYKNTQVKYYPLGDEMFSDLIRDLESAEHYIFMEYFIVSDGVMWESVKTILKEKAAQGLDVRFVYDDLGSISCIPKQFARDLREAGIKVMVFNPFRPALFAVMNNRNHRKITVVDGYIAYTGGLNLADEYINQKERFGHWKDTAVRIYGDAAFSFTKMCLELWNAFYKTNDHCSQYLPHIYHPEPFPSDGFVQPYCNSPFEDENLAQRVYLDMLYQAKQYVYIFTPYLAIDNEMQNALCAAAKRGVDVRIVTPGIPDKRVMYSLTRSYYEPLLYAGVRIYEYTPGFIHAKSYLVDGYMGIVGTINMDYRGLYLHMEDAVFMVGCSALEELKLDCIVTLEQSHRVTLQECKQRRHNLLWQAFLRTISPLL